MRINHLGIPTPTPPPPFGLGGNPRNNKHKYNMKALSILSEDFTVKDLMEANEITGDIGLIKTPKTGSIILIIGNKHLCFAEKALWDKASSLTQKDRQELIILECDKGFVAISPRTRGEVR